MKKTISVIVQILPFLAIAFYLLYTMYSIVHAFVLNGGMSFASLSFLNITRENTAKTILTLLISCGLLILHSAYVFCALLGIGSIENKWIRMIFLMLAGAELLTTYSVTALFIILSVILYPEKTGIKHALRSTFIFVAISFILSVRVINISPLDYIKTNDALDGLIAFETIRYAVAVIIGVVGAFFAAKLRKKPISIDKFSKPYFAGNIFTIARFLLIVTSVVLMVRKTEYKTLPQIEYSILPECVLILLTTLIIGTLALLLAYSMKNKYVFFISCVTLAMCISVAPINLIYFEASLSALSGILIKQMYYMLLFAVIIGMFNKEQEISRTVPAAVSMLMPIFYMTVRELGITSKLFISNLNSTFDDYIYHYGRVASGEKIYTLIIGYILICIGIVIATALIKNKHGDLISKL